MARFLDWYNATRPWATDHRIPGPLRAAIAHLWFESIHFFDDGNGRAIADHALAQDLGYPPLSSLSSVIEVDKKAYSAIREQTQRRNLRIDDGLTWFVATVLAAQDMARERVAFVVERARFFDRVRDRLNTRQHEAIEGMFAAGPTGFEGGMTAGKYIALTRCAKATATRDLSALLKIGALTNLPGGGRSTRYALSHLEPAADDVEPDEPTGG